MASRILQRSGRPRPSERWVRPSELMMAAPPKHLSSGKFLGAQLYPQRKVLADSSGPRNSRQGSLTYRVTWPTPVWTTFSHDQSRDLPLTTMTLNPTLTDMISLSGGGITVTQLTLLRPLLQRAWQVAARLKVATPT